MNKVAVFLYDYTGIMAKPWLTEGYTCYIVDGQHEEGIVKRDTGTKGTLYTVGHMFSTDITKEVIFLQGVAKEPSFVFGFPPCTDVAVSGAAHFKKKAKVNPQFQQDAKRLALIVEAYGKATASPWGWENPISVLSTLIRKPSFIFHPWEYGGYLEEDDVHPEYPKYIAPRDAYPKKTCIWCSNTFKIPSKLEVPVPLGYSTQHTKLGGRSIRTKNIRSATPRGFALAIFEANK
jgi:hypothetical protein